MFIVISLNLQYEQMSRRREKTGFFAYAKTKTQIKLRGNREADQRLCFRYTG